MSEIKTAVILAAGLGSRLGDLKEQKPKAFLEIGGEALIDRSIRLLFEHGIEKIIIGTGYKHEFFDALRSRYSQVETFQNEKFDQTGSMYTLFVLKDLIEGDFLLLEGDLLYEKRAIENLLTDPRADVILGSTATHSGDEVFIQSDANGFLQKMSKKKNDLKGISGELVGITKLSRPTGQALTQFARGQYERDQFGIHYEDALVGISSQIPLYVKVEDDLAWCEIDDAAHLSRARNQVLPKIRARE